MARIASLHCYPLKSGAAIDLQRACLTATGIALDRNWMAIVPDGRFLTQREVPRLALIRPELALERLILRAAGHDDLQLPLEADGVSLRVQIWSDQCTGIDAGEPAAAWLGEVLRCPCRLVRFAPAQRRLSAAAWSGDVVAENRFSDGFPLLVVGRASLDDLNARMGRELPMQRFRPNIVLDDIEPYAEDRIDELHSGALRLRLVKPCTRCRITTTDQSSAQADGDEPLRTLKAYRFDSRLHGVLFGQNAVIVEGIGSTLACGQRLQIRWK